MHRAWLQRTLIIVLILGIGLSLCVAPCLAGTRYFSGGPDLLVSLDTTNNLVPGTTAELPLVIENRGIVTMEFYNEYTIQPTYIPTTALFATVRLIPGDAPVRVKTNPQVVGDIPSGMMVPATFTVEVPQDAASGNYTMKAVLTYQYVPEAEQERTTDIEYYFKNAETVLPVPVVIRPMVVLSVEEVESAGLHAGGEGYVTFTVKNTGQDTGNRTSVYLVPEGAAPLVPYSNGIYIGDLPPGGVAQLRYKVAISENADPSQPSPVSLYAVYRDYEGNTLTTPRVSTGVYFGEKITFVRTSQPANSSADETRRASSTMSLYCPASSS